MLGKYIGMLLRAIVYGVVIGILGAKYGWHGLVVGLLGTMILALWEISDSLTEIRDQLGTRANTDVLDEEG